MHPLALALRRAQQRLVAITLARHEDAVAVQRLLGAAFTALTSDVGGWPEQLDELTLLLNLVARMSELHELVHSLSAIEPASVLVHARPSDACLVQRLPTRPKQQQKPVAAQGSKSRVAVGKAAAASGASQAKAKKGAGSTEQEWAWESMRTRNFQMGEGGFVLDFQSDVHSTEEGWSTKKSPFKRLLLWPVVPTFGERMDMEVCGGDAAVIQMHTALCTLHAAHAPPRSHRLRRCHFPRPRPWLLGPAARSSYA